MALEKLDPRTCPHDDVEAVIQAGTTNEVATVCRQCLDTLPIGYGCARCDWDPEAIRLLDGTRIPQLISPCPDHR